MVSLKLGIIGRNSLVAANCYCGGDNSNGKGGGTDKKLADLANVWR
jgi:hypothetical protein